MLAVAVSARAFTTDPRIEGYIVPQASNPTVASDARRGSRPMAEHRVMSEVLLYITHYRSRRCDESQCRFCRLTLRRNLGGLEAYQPICPGDGVRILTYSCPQEPTKPTKPGFVGFVGFVGSLLRSRRRVGARDGFNGQGVCGDCASREAFIGGVVVHSCSMVHRRRAIRNETQKGMAHVFFIKHWPTAGCVPPASAQ
jgi:hypothetical protein